jgi:transposase
MTRPNGFSPEVREGAVRMVFEHGAAHESQWAAITSIAEKIGGTAETLRKWGRQAERDQDTRPGLTTEERQRLTLTPLPRPVLALGRLRRPRFASEAVAIYRP